MLAVHITTDVDPTLGQNVWSIHWQVISVSVISASVVSDHRVSRESSHTHLEVRCGEVCLGIHTYSTTRDSGSFRHLYKTKHLQRAWQDGCNVMSTCYSICANSQGTQQHMASKTLNKLEGIHTYVHTTCVLQICCCKRCSFSLVGHTTSSVRARYCTSASTVSWPAFMQLRNTYSCTHARTHAHMHAHTPVLHKYKVYFHTLRIYTPIYVVYMPLRNM